MIETQTERRRAALARPQAHVWRVDVYYAGLCITVYHSTDFERACKRIGDMACSAATERILVYRDGKPYRLLDVTRGEKG